MFLARYSWRGDVLSVPAGQEGIRENVKEPFLGSDIQLQLRKKLEADLGLSVDFRRQACGIKGVAFSRIEIPGAPGKLAQYRTIMRQPPEGDGFEETVAFPEPPDCCQSIERECGNTVGAPRR